MKQQISSCIAVLTFGALWLSGCGTVDPSPDYEETARLVRERTGSEQVFTPDLDPQTVRGRVEHLLDGGLTEDEAVQVALLKNSGLRALFHQVGVSRADLVQAGLLSNPSLSLSTRWPVGGGIPNITVNAAQNIVELLLIPIRKQIARAELDAARLEAARQAVRIVAGVKRGVYRVLALIEAEKIAREDLELAQRSTKLAEDRFAGGEADKVDVDLARAELLDVKREIITIRRDRNVARAELARGLGLARWERTWSVTGDLPLPDTVEKDEDLLRLAAAKRLDVKASSLQVEAAQDEVSRQYWKILPSASVGFEVERPEGPPTLLGPTFDLTVPIWDQNLARIARARFLLEKRRAEHEALLDLAAQEVRAAAAAARGDAELVRFYQKELLPKAQDTIAAARRSYEAGRRDILSLMHAQASLVRLRREHTAALRDYATALADLENAVGGRLPSEPDRAEGEDGAQ